MTSPARTLPDPQAEPTISVTTAAKIIGISRAAAYAAAARGDLPSIRVGKSVRIPTARFLRYAGLIDGG